MLYRLPCQIERICANRRDAAAACASVLGRSATVIAGNGAENARLMIARVRRALRQAIPVTEFNLSEIGMAEVKEGHLGSEPVQRAIFILRARGCSWALKEDGGCTMCGHFAGTTRGSPVDASMYIRQFANELDEFDFSCIPVLCLYNSGSLLNDDELQQDARREIFRLIAAIPEIRHLIIESRPEYVTEAGLAEIDELLSGKTVEIGTGLECYDDDVRSICLNKGFDRQKFLDAATLIRKSHAKLLAYVLLKPPFLTESEAIEEAVKAIHFAFENGADVVSLEPVSVQDFSLVHYLHEAGQYRTPWIWSVFEVIRRTASLGEVRIGGFEFLPIPMIFTHNCPTCDPACSKAIVDFNRGGGTAQFDAISCTCIDEWRRAIAEKDDRPLAERITALLSSIDEERTLRRVKESNSWKDRVKPPRHPGTGGAACP
jgi:radical SAM enzyme (TIGR01210 family)